MAMIKTNYSLPKIGGSEALMATFGRDVAHDALRRLLDHVLPALALD